jgi:FkbM family methyltransferase
MMEEKPVEAVETVSLYKSQFGQDKWLNEKFFKNKEKGVFVEVGANDGVTFSNTYFFETNLKWTGLCIEPIPKTFEVLKKNRKCHCVWGCAYSKVCRVPFKCIEGYSEMLSGIATTYDPRHEQRIQSESKQHGCTEKTIQVPAYKLGDLLAQYKMKNIDYISIDTEGSELEVLQGLYFHKINVHVFGIEENYPDKAGPVRDLMKKHGYNFLEKVGEDCMFVNSQWKE